MHIVLSCLTTFWNKRKKHQLLIFFFNDSWNFFCQQCPLYECLWIQGRNLSILVYIPGKSCRAQPSPRLTTPTMVAFGFSLPIHIHNGPPESPLQAFLKIIKKWIREFNCQWHFICHSIYVCSISVFPNQGSVNLVGSL